MKNPAHSSLTHPTYRADIDGLRAIAVLAVVVFHAFPSLVPGGFIGVDIFFVISGFLISTIILKGLNSNSFSFIDFYGRRIRRIFPALFVVLSTCYTFGWFALLAEEYKQLGKHIAAGAGFFSNFSLLSEAGYFDSSAETKPLLHLWSLGIEEQFYIVWPLLLWLTWKARLSVITITVILAIASFALNLRGVYNQDLIATFYLPQTRAWELLSGGILAWFSLSRKSNLENEKYKAIGQQQKLIFISHTSILEKLFGSLSFLGFVLLFIGFWYISSDLPFPGMLALLPVLGSCLIILAGPNAWLNRVFLTNKVLVWFGLISFPLYLWHWPLLSFIRIIESNTPFLDDLSPY